MIEVALVLTVLFVVGALAIALGVTTVLRAGGDGAAAVLTAPRARSRVARPHAPSSLRSHA